MIWKETCSKLSRFRRALQAYVVNSNVDKKRILGRYSNKFIEDISQTFAVMLSNSWFLKVQRVGILSPIVRLTVKQELWIITSPPPFFVRDVKRVLEMIEMET